MLEPATYLVRIDTHQDNVAATACAALKEHHVTKTSSPPACRGPTPALGMLDDSEDEWQDMPIERVGGGGTLMSPSHMPLGSTSLLDDSDDDEHATGSPRTQRAIREAQAMRRRHEHLRGRRTAAQ